MHRMPCFEWLLNPVDCVMLIWLVAINAAYDAIIHICFNLIMTYFNPDNPHKTPSYLLYGRREVSWLGSVLFKTISSLGHSHWPVLTTNWLQNISSTSNVTYSSCILDLFLGQYYFELKIQAVSVNISTKWNVSERCDMFLALYDFLSQITYRDLWVIESQLIGSGIHRRWSVPYPVYWVTFQAGRGWRAYVKKKMTCF